MTALSAGRFTARPDVPAPLRSGLGMIWHASGSGCVRQVILDHGVRCPLSTAAV